MNIGAKALSEKAKELEMAAKGQQYDIILKDHEAMMEAYRALLDGIGKFMEQGN